MKIIIFFLVFFIVGKSAAAEVPECGMVMATSPSKPSDQLWLLGSAFAEVGNGFARITDSSGSPELLAFSQPDETVVLVTEMNGEKYFLTRSTRGLVLYQWQKNGGKHILQLIRTEPLMAEVDERKLFSPLMDAWQASNGTLYLLTLFEIRSVEASQFFSVNTPSYQKISLPTELMAKKLRPMAFSPWWNPRLRKTEVALFHAKIQENSEIMQWFSFLPENPLKLINVEYSFFQAPYLYPFPNRDVSSKSRWISVGTTLWALKQSYAYENFYPNDAFEKNGELLVSYYGLGTFFQKNGTIVCRAFPDKMRSAIIFEQDTATGKQKVFLGATEAGQLLKTAQYKNY